VDVVETEEICVASNYMTYEDYRECRALNLTMEIFINDAIIYELLKFLDNQGISRTDFVRNVHEKVNRSDSPLANIYKDFTGDEEKNLWDSPDEVNDFITQPGVVEGYVDGKYGYNEIQKFRALAVCEHMDTVHDISFDAARELLGDGARDEGVDLYLSDLHTFSLMRKGEFFDAERRHTHVFHFDFEELMDSNFTIDPFDVKCPEGVALEIFHTGSQREMIDGWVRQYDSSLMGLARIFSRAQLSAMYRSVKKADGGREFTPALVSEEAR
jgi:hypothetical protein